MVIRFNPDSLNNTDVQDCRTEWAVIKAEFHRIENCKNELEKRYLRKIIFFDVVFIFASGAVVTVTTPYLPEQWRLFSPLLCCILIAFSRLFKPNASGLKRRLKALDNELQLLYRCPGKKSNGNRCDRMFGTSIQPNVLEANPQCNSCGAQYI